MATRTVSSFGEILRTYRAAAGLTQEVLAERVGMGARGISDLERGVRRTPYRGTVQLLADALNPTQEEHSAFVQAARRRGRPIASYADAAENADGTLPPLVVHGPKLVQQP